MEDYRRTPCGDIQGVPGEAPGYSIFKGIRYATAERFALPKLVEAWEGVYDATAFAACCYQPRAVQEEQGTKAFYAKEFRQDSHFDYSEDCLFLNIWAPEHGADLPVIVYIHGGAFTGGAGHEKHLDGRHYASQGVILVTINYRLGPFGFYADNELIQEAGITGNYGLWDQLMALKWIQRNISSFGGNPKRITLMGQSAGAMSVQQLCFSRRSKELFQGAIMLSGGGVNPRFDALPLEDYIPRWKNFASHFGCSNLADLKALPAADLMRHFISYQDPKEELFCRPCLDGELLESSGSAAANQGLQKNIPYLMGSCSEDIHPLELASSARDWCLLQSRLGRTPGYVYFFNRAVPGDEHGAFHSSDLWYAFGRLDRSWRPFTSLDQQISQRLIQSILAFAKGGEPSGEGLPLWLPCTMDQKKVMGFGKLNRLRRLPLSKLQWNAENLRPPGH